MPPSARRTLFLTVLSAVCLAGSPPAPGEAIEESPLNGRSLPAGSTLFTELSPEETGVVTVNDYADPRMWGDRYQEIALGGFGTGVTIGDYDSDGRPDLFVVSKTESCRLFRNLGDFRFEDVTEKSGLSGAPKGWIRRMKGWVGMADGDGETFDPLEAWKQGATFVDVNNDGHLDLYVCRFASPNWLFINQGDGTFIEEAGERGLALVDASGMAAFADYDRDGWLDVFIQTNMLDAQKAPEGQPDFLFRNRGDGFFENVTAGAGISGSTLAHSVVWWDYNNDLWPDIYVTNDFGGPDALYRNNGDGTFTDVINEVVPMTPYSSMGSDLGDVNNDGLVDLFVADMAVTSHVGDHRGMASSRDLVFEDSDSPTLAPQMPRNALYLNTDTGRMLEGAYLAGLPATDWTWSPRFEDLDNDGRLDLFVTNGMNREYQNADLRQRIILSESLSERMRLMRESPELREANLAFRNLGELRFEPIGPAWGLDHVGISFGTAFGDLDGDGDQDIVFGNYQAGVTLLRNDSDSGNRVVIALNGEVSNRFGVGAEVHLETASGVQVRSLVLARGYLSTSEPVCHFGVGRDDVIVRLTVAWPSGHEQSFFDLPVNRRFVIHEPEGPAVPAAVGAGAPSGLFDEVGAAINLELSTAEVPVAGGREQPLLPMRFDRRGPDLAVGDLNGDGLDDVVIAGTSAEPPRIAFATVDGRYAVVDLPDLRSEASVSSGPITVLDVDGDGNDDLLVTRSGSRMPAGSSAYQPAVFLNDGTGRFRPAPKTTLPELGISTGAAVSADFNRDGQPDVFIGGRVEPGAYPTAPRSALLLNRGGRFEEVTEDWNTGLDRVGMVSAALAADVDLDGWPDLLLALEWGGVRYFRNRSGEGFEDLTGEAGFGRAGTGWWSALTAADFNGDGRPDLAVGNVGLNTVYSYRPEEAAEIWFGAFSRRGNPLLIEAYHENDVLYPRRTLRSLGRELPAVKRKFKFHDDYAAASLGEILGEDRLAEAEHFRADEFRSGVFLSQPDGTFVFEALPRIAQISPAEGMVAGDFDGDGAADLFIVQNLYAPISFVGRFTGGLGQLLLGDGEGGFRAVPPRESGLIVPGDAKDVVLLDFDGDGRPGFLVSRNNSTLLAFRRSLQTEE